MRTFTKLGIACLSATMLCQGAWGKEFKFDFGPKDSPVAAGFTQATENDIYSDEKGYGWFDLKKRQKLYSRNENFSTQRAFLKLGSAYSDHVTGGRNYNYPKYTCKFKVKLEKGDYVGAVIMGKMTEKYSATLNRPPFWFANYKVSVNDKTIADVNNGDLKSYLGKFCSASEENFFPGDSLFDKFIKGHFSIYNFTVSGDEAIIEMSSLCPINALLIYPKAEEKKLKNEVAKLLKEEGAFVDAQYKENKPEEKTLSADIKAKFAKRGMILFSSSEPEITPYTTPEIEEAFRPSGEFLAMGEKGVLRFGILPLKDLKDSKILVSDFVSKSGEKISSDNFELWLSQCTAYTQENQTVFYNISPYYAFPYKTQALKANVSRQFFLYVKLPESTKAGDYSGSIAVESGTNKADLKLFVKVLPFKLKQSKMTMGMYAYSPKSTRLRFATMQNIGKKMYKTQQKTNYELQEKGLKEMKEAGFNTVAQGPSVPFKFDKSGKIVKNGDGFDYWVDFMNLYMKTFGEKPLPAYGIGWSKMLSEGIVPGFYWRNMAAFKKNGLSEDGKAKAAQIVKHFYKKVKEHKWPEIIFYDQDEMANHGVWGGRLALERAKFFRKLSKKVGFRTCASMNGPVELPEIPYLDISIPNGALPINEENIKKMRDAGSEYWIYNIGRKRFTMGFYLTKDNPKGRLQWSFYGASSYLSQIPTLPSLGSITFSLMWDSKLNPSRRLDVEDLRQGIMDYRYFITLKDLTEKNGKSQKAKMQEAVKNAKELMEMIRGGISTEIGKARSGIWSNMTCQRLRWRIAMAIKEIKDAE